MTRPEPDRSEWIRELLQDGCRLSLGTLLASLVPAESLRELARRHDLSPRGYRVDRTPVSRLIPLLTDPAKPEVVEEACDLLLAEMRRAPEKDGGSEDTVPGELLRLREQELVQLREQLRRVDQQAARQRDRTAELERRLEVETEKKARLRAELGQARRRLEASAAKGPAESKDQQQRIHELERDLETLGEAEEGLRRLLALRAARIKELEARVAGLERLVPKGRRKKTPKAEEPSLADGFRLPYLTQSFYKSLEGKDRRSVEKAFQAVLLFCTEGPSYPGLEVKQIEGQEQWSLRASLKLRVYFEIREDHDVDFVWVADREDQDTALKRLKAR